MAYTEDKPKIYVDRINEKIILLDRNGYGKEKIEEFLKSVGDKLSKGVFTDKEWKDVFDE